MDCRLILGVLLTLALVGALAVLAKKRDLGFVPAPSLDACERLVRDYLSKRRYMEAVVVAKKATESHPENPIGEVLLAEVHIAQGKRPQARAALEAVLERFPHHTKAVKLMQSLDGS